jgi:hypothetical protein
MPDVIVKNNRDGTCLLIMYATRAIQRVRLFYSRLKDSCIELASKGSVSAYIHHQTSVIVTTSDDVNRHSSSFKMATVLKEGAKEVRSGIFYGQKSSTC